MTITDNTTFKKNGFGESNGHSSPVSNFGDGCVTIGVFIMVDDVVFDGIF